MRFYPNQILMKTSNLTLLLTLGFALLFATLFFEHTWGLNMFLLQLSLFILPFGLKQVQLKGIVNYSIVLGTFFSIVFAFFHHTTLALVTSWISLSLFFTIAASLQVRSVDTVLLSSGANAVLRIPRMAVALKNLRIGKQKKMRLLPRVRIIIPVMVVGLFMALYSHSSPTFRSFSSGFFDFFEDAFEFIFQDLNPSFVGWLILGLFIMSALILKQIPNKWLLKDNEKSNTLVRTKNYFKGKLPALKTENKLGVRLLFVLNTMALIVMVGEIKDVWFNFEFEGQLLKSFVHSGMYTLLVAILISVGIALYYFRGNQNFYKKNKTLKILTSVWLVENALLVIAVFIRNGIYIQHYALAYKRIALIFFLAACLIGIASVLIKIHSTKNVRYLMRLNSLGVYILIVSSCTVNWDVLIAKYNFSNKERSFVHLNYLATLNDASLPYLSKDPEILNQIQTQQRKKFSSSSYQNSIDPKTYTEIIAQKQSKFITFWNSKHWLEWNPSEQKAFDQLSQMDQ